MTIALPSITPSETSLLQVRAQFNPSGLSGVDRVKLFAAALITELEPIKAQGGEAGRCAAIAITHIETGAMFGVKAVTT